MWLLALWAIGIALWWATMRVLIDLGSAREQEKRRQGYPGRR